MVGQLYLLAVTVLLLFALAITLPVIRDIVTEALDRRHDQKTKALESEPSHSEETNDERSVGGERCPECGAVNDGEFTFCQECSERL